MQPVSDPPSTAQCPPGVDAGTRCLSGQDSAGAYYLIAVPTGWNGDLVLHDHGGPFLGAPQAKRVEEDLTRWSVFPRLGYAWAASSYRQGGVAVTAAAEDTERLRLIVQQVLGKPRHVWLHGQSWGAGVAAKGAELFTVGRPYDGVLLTAGVLGGGPRSYDFRLDLRVVYQYLCHNHPRADEPAYPLNIGLPEHSTLTAEALSQRINACLGIDKPARERSAEQQRKLQTLLDVVRIPERSVVAHMNWATFHFREIVVKRTGGASPFGNLGVVYHGSADDKALNAGVERVAAEPAAVAAFTRDAGLSGRIPVPVLTVHAIHDPTAFVELQDTFGHIMEAAGHGDDLVQAYTDDREHSYLSDPTYAALIGALSAWVVGGDRPTPTGLARDCERARARVSGTCRFRPDYTPPALSSRTPAR
ncbi:hypothetical protein [Roseateles sp. YR242]|uniref:hypothetical protein n=1 Tax=Roseateles sp. YR242 TaxID=1855305 RepID=UPI001160456F|nr:hypothetical protein [Roseateles sp. YR242]